MAGQDELHQVGVEIMVKEPVAQDTPMQEDVPPQPNPEVAMGAGAAANNPPPLPHIKCPSRPLADLRPAKANRLHWDHLT